MVVRLAAGEGRRVLPADRAGRVRRMGHKRRHDDRASMAPGRRVHQDSPRLPVTTAVGPRRPTAASTTPPPIRARSRDDAGGTSTARFTVWDGSNHSADSSQVTFTETLA